MQPPSTHYQSRQALIQGRTRPGSASAPGLSRLPDAASRRPGCSALGMHACTHACMASTTFSQQPAGQVREAAAAGPACRCKKLHQLTHILHDLGWCRRSSLAHAVMPQAFSESRPRTLPTLQTRAPCGCNAHRNACHAHVLLEAPPAATRSHCCSCCGAAHLCQVGVGMDAG